MPTITLDRARPLKWTMRTEYRLGGLTPAPSLAELDGKNHNRAFRSLCCHVWACLHEPDAPATPDEVADYFDTPEKRTAAIEALYNALVEAGRIKKKVTAAPST